MPVSPLLSLGSDKVFYVTFDKFPLCFSATFQVKQMFFNQDWIKSISPTSGKNWYELNSVDSIIKLLLYKDYFEGTSLAII